MGGGRGGGRGGGAGAGNNRGGRGGSLNRGSMNQNRGSRTGSMFMGGNSGGGGPRGGGGGQTAPLRGHSSQGAFRNNRRGGFTGGGGQNMNASFRGGGGGRNANQNRRHDGGGGGSGGAFGARDASFSNINGAGKKSEHLADFKIIGLEMRELGWSWGVLPSEKLIVKAEVTDAMKGAEGNTVEETQRTQQTEQTQTDTLGADSVSELENSSEAIKQEPTQDADVSASLNKDTSIQSVATSNGSTVPAPPSRMRIYFHTPVTPDDSNPHSLNASGSFSIPADSNSRKGKRKKLEDDDGDLEDSGRGKRPAPHSQMAGGSDTASIDMDVAGRGSVAPSMAGTSESGDWLMAHIAQDDREDEGDHDVDAEGDNEGEGDDDKLNVSQILDADEDVATEVADDENDVGKSLFVTLFFFDTACFVLPPRGRRDSPTPY